MFAVVDTYPITCYEQPALEEVLADCLPILAENTVVVIPASMVAICEGSFDCQGAGDGFCVLKPADPQYTANKMHGFLAKHYGVENVGITIVHDSMSLFGSEVLGPPLARFDLTAPTHMLLLQSR